MNKSILTMMFTVIMVSCSQNKNMQKISELPACLETTIKNMTSDPSQGTPQSVTRYTYKQQTVYYMLSACCDKYNIVYDSDCNILGYPDGGLAGRGDGKMTDFKDKATYEKEIWHQ